MNFEDIKTKLGKPSVSYFVMPSIIDQFTEKEHDSLAEIVLRNLLRRYIKERRERSMDMCRIQLSYVPDDFSSVPLLRNKLNSTVEAMNKFNEYIKIYAKSEKCTYNYNST